MKTNQWLYFGCHRASGHYLFVEGMHPCRDYALNKLAHLDGKLPSQESDEPYVATVSRLEGWSMTALAFWDYSVDTRRGCNSVIFAPSLTIDPDDLLTEARARFPTVFERLPQPVRLRSQSPQSVNARLIEALRFYAAGNHFMLFNKDAWDTVSGEPLNLLADEADTAMVEDGSIAKAAIAEAAALQISFDLHTVLTGVKEFFDGEYFEIKGIVDATKCRGQRQEEECQPYFNHCLVMQDGGGITGDDFHGTVYFHLAADQYLAVDF